MQQTTPNQSRTQKNNILLHFRSGFRSYKTTSFHFSTIFRDFSGFGSPDSLAKDFKGFGMLELARMKILKESTGI